ncbi:MAG: glycosyltransferase family 2 protein [Candidatus Gastranaerophilales bacterium]|nr:glycosyltransferase family 2 protein [Candidatus Gastranaerophilales bacterium]
MKTISGVINTYNNDETLEECLQSLKDCDEIVICDMHSNDRTIEIAEKYGCKICYHENVGHCDPARNFALSNATSDYSIILDADEVASPDLINNLKKYITENEDAAEGIRIFYNNELLGKVLKSYSKEGILRCFKKGHIHYGTQIHCAPEVSGREIVFGDGKHSYITHKMITDLGEHAAKWNTYTTFEANEKYIANGRTISAKTLIFRPIGEFIKIYFLKKGFLDGLHGFVFAVYAANYKFMVLAKVWEHQLKTAQKTK